jgi:hypothetical protein
MKTILHEPQQIREYYSEYLKRMNFYFNTAKTGITVRYFNIAMDVSTYEEDIESTFDIYNVSNIQFNCYENTPVQQINPVQNTTADIGEMDGHRFDGDTTIVVYAIKRPRIHDVVSFYEPANITEYFRVVDISTPLNAVHSSDQVTWYSLMLEYAPIEDINRLKINKTFIYDQAKEQFIEKDDYVSKINTLNKLGEFVPWIMERYDHRREVYKVAELNDIVINIKRRFGYNYNRLFEKLLYPWGWTPEQYYIDMNKFDITKEPVVKLLTDIYYNTSYINDDEFDKLVELIDIEKETHKDIF